MKELTMTHNGYNKITISTNMNVEIGCLVREGFLSTLGFQYSKNNRDLEDLEKLPLKVQTFLEDHGIKSMVFTNYIWGDIQHLLVFNVYTVYEIKRVQTKDFYEEDVLQIIELYYEPSAES